MPHLPDSAALRRLLTGALTQTQFEVLLFDNFRAVYDSAGAGESHAARVQALIDYVERQGLVPHLLQCVYDLNPRAMHDAGPGGHTSATARWEAARIPRQAPPLPPHVVPRRTLSRQIKARLLAGEAKTAGVLPVSVLHGLPGSGKSTLAASLAHDRQVQAHFVDGILWAALGQAPDLLLILRSWLAALGDMEPPPPDTAAAGLRLRSLAAERRLLMIVDDAWAPEHARAFLAGGPACHLLITARDMMLAAVTQSQAFDVGMMSEAEGLRLLVARGRPLARAAKGAASADDAAALRAIARELGGLPLALDLAAGQLAEGVSPTGLAQDLRIAADRLAALDWPAGHHAAHEDDRKIVSLQASFDLSVVRLPRTLRACFAWLGVLPAGVLLTSALLRTLWDVDETTAVTTARSLFHKALLSRAGADRSGRPAYRLHDLLHAYARRCLTAPQVHNRLPGLGLTWPDAHASLLDRYRRQTTNQAWQTLPADGYIHAHLTWHLLEGGQSQAVHDLLAAQTAEGENAWYAACDRLGMPAVVARDLARGQDLARAAGDIGLACRYRLMAASQQTVVRSLPGPAMARLLQHRLWTPDQALQQALQTPGAAARSADLLSLMPYLPDAALNKALDVLLDLTAYLATTDQAGAGTRLLVSAMPHVPVSRIAEVRAAGGYSPDVTAAAAVRLADCGEVAAACELIGCLETPPARAGTAPFLDSGRRTHALPSTRAPADDPAAYCEVLAAVAARASAEQAGSLLARAITVARRRPLPAQQARALAAMLARVPQARAGPVKQALQAVMPQIDAPEERLAAISATLSFLAPAARQRMAGTALQLLQTLPAPGAQVAALESLIGHLAPDQYPALIEAIRHLPASWHRSRAIAATAAYASPGACLRLAELVAQIVEPVWRARAAAALVPHLPAPAGTTLVAQTLELAHRVDDARARAEILGQLLPYSPLALAELQQIQDPALRSMAIEPLWEQLPADLLLPALTLVRGILDPDARAAALAALAEWLPEATTTAQPEPDAAFDPRVIAFDRKRLPEAVRRALAVIGVFPPSTAGARPAYHWPEAGAADQEIVMWDALAALPEIQDEPTRLAVIEQLAPHWSQPALAALLRNPVQPGDVLARLAPWLPPALLGEARAVLDGLEGDGACDEAAAALAARYAGLHDLASALDLVLQLETGPARQRGLAAVARQMAGLPADEAEQAWWQLLPRLAAASRPALLADLQALAPLIAALAGEPGLRKVIRAIADCARWWP